MPTRQPIRPIRPSPTSVTRGGSRKVVVVMIVVILAMLTGLYFLLSRRSPQSERQLGSGGAAVTGERVTGVQSGTSVDAGVALGKARLLLESVGDKDIVRVVLDKPAGGDDSAVTYRFEWTLNGQPAGDGGDSLTGFKRGDRVAVKVTPVQDGKAGSSRILDFLVQNTPPKVTENQDMKFEGNTFSYQVKATDSDGDTLSYALEDAPDGMTIDPQTGAIRWQLKEGDYGERTIKVKVSDGKGGVANYSLKVDFKKPSPEKATGVTPK